MRSEFTPDESQNQQDLIQQLQELQQLEELIVEYYGVVKKQKEIINKFITEGTIPKNQKDLVVLSEKDLIKQIVTEETKLKGLELGTFHTGDGRKCVCAYSRQSNGKKKKDMDKKGSGYIAGHFLGTKGEQRPCYLSKHDVAPESFYPAYPKRVSVAFGAPKA